MITLEFLNNFRAPNKFYKLQESLRPHKYHPVELAVWAGNINTGHESDGNTNKSKGYQSHSLTDMSI